LGGNNSGALSGRRVSVVRARLLRTRQRFLSAMGRHCPRAGRFSVVDATPCTGLRRSSSVPASTRSGQAMSAASRDAMMTAAAARLLHDGDVCFVGIGLPSAACNLARLTHAPDIVLIYESGTIGVAPEVLPLSIGDGELAETATALVPLPEVFSYWLQAGRVDVGFLGAAQIDRFGNLNTTVIGGYGKPKTRMPGAGGAPEIAHHAKQI